jgi:predicted extracellular nuclease
MKRLIFFLTITPFFCFSQNTNSDNFSDELFLMFYNVENLFDTIDNPNTKDEEFLPLSEKKWDSYRYNYKLNQLEKVFNKIIEKENEKNIPDIIGLCEIENKLVIEDLLKTDVFKNHNYSIIHKQSPDGRGIDCALLVNSKFEVLQNDFIQINNPKESRKTRDIVYSRLKFKNQIINVFVNHWPSRWGGQEASNHKRVFVAKVLRKYIDENTSQNDFNLIMGDFNDYPSNESLDEILVKDDLINLMSSNQVSGKGSYNYRGNWNWLDQIIVSKEISSFKSIKFGAFEEDFMMYTNKKGELYPSRSFGGKNWYGGYSDHLPVFLKMSYLVK